MQGQINSNKDAIAALQKLVGQGKWVSSITPVENGFTVTMSDGSSQTVKGINGKDGIDGKNGTEWTISEDGFWVKDGEKTTHKAVATDGKDGQNGEQGEAGKNGVTAPSPKINAEGLWVVYEWNEEKGEFVEVTTEVSAKGTSAYVVKKDGVYVLHIANEAGIYEDVVLPATSDAFTAEAPYSKVVVKFETAEWTEWDETKDAAKALAEAFPELKDIQKKALVKQGGNLPILVTPANIALDDNFTFSLNKVNGEAFEAVVSNPTKGLPLNTKIVEDGKVQVWYDRNNNGRQESWELSWETKDKHMETRSAADDCFWSVKVDPKFNESTKSYAADKDLSLTITNAKGTKVKTAFAYTIESEPIYDYDYVYASTNDVEYAPEIDLLAGNDKAAIVLKNEYAGRHIITLTSALQVKKYGLSIAEDGRTLKIANMPVDANSIEINVNVKAVGLNGSVFDRDLSFSVAQEVKASTTLENKSLVLNGKDQFVKWNISELGLEDPIQFNKVMKAGFSMKMEGKNFTHYDNIKFFNAEGKETYYNNRTGAWSNKEAKEFGIKINATEGITPTFNPWIAGEIALTLEAKDGSIVVYSATSTLTLSLPSDNETLASLIHLVPGYTENGVLQLVNGTEANRNYVEAITRASANTFKSFEYPLTDKLFVLGKDVQILRYEDVAFTDAENHSDMAQASSWNWVKRVNTGTGEAPVYSYYFVANKWYEKDNAIFNKEHASYVCDWSKAGFQQINEKRTVRAYVSIFGNKNAVVKYEFDVVMKSTVYDATGASVTFDAKKLTSNFATKPAINVEAAIKEAKYVAGTNKGVAYSLFAHEATTTATESKVNDYRFPVVSGSTQVTAPNTVVDAFVLNAAGQPIQIDDADLIKFGMAVTDYTALNGEKFYLNHKDNVSQHSCATLYGFGDMIIDLREAGIYDIVAMDASSYANLKQSSNYYWEWKQLKADKDITDPVLKTKLALVKKYIGKGIAFVETRQVPTFTVTTVKKQDRAAEISANPTISFVNKEDAKYFEALTEGSMKLTPSLENIIDPQDVTVKMNLIITDKWGMTMKVPFEVNVTKVAPVEE